MAKRINAYREFAKEWLDKNKYKLKFHITDVSAFIEKIIQSQLSTTRLDFVRDTHGNTMVHYALKLYYAIKKQIPPEPEKEKKLLRMILNILKRGASIYAANPQNQTANEFATGATGSAKHMPNEHTEDPSGKKAERVISANDVKYDEMFDWPSLIEIIESIPVRKDSIPEDVKEVLLKYSHERMKELKDWNWTDSLRYNHRISSVSRLNEVLTIGKFLHMAYWQISDTILHDAIRQLAKNSPRGFFNNSRLYDWLEDALQGKKRKKRTQSNPVPLPIHHHANTLVMFAITDQVELLHIKGEETAKEVVTVKKKLQIATAKSEETNRQTEERDRQREEMYRKAQEEAIRANKAAQEAKEESRQAKEDIATLKDQFNMFMQMAQSQFNTNKTGASQSIPVLASSSHQLTFFPPANRGTMIDNRSAAGHTAHDQPVSPPSVPAATPTLNNNSTNN